MPLDERLRDAFERTADGIDPTVEANLEKAIRRGTQPRQSQTRALLAAAIAVVVLVVGIQYVFPAAHLGGPDASASPTSTPVSDLGQVAGSYMVTLAADDPGVADLGLAGDWALILRPTGGMELTAPPSFAGSDAEGHTFTLEGSTLRTDLYYNDYCDGIGEYEWSLTSDGLGLGAIEDDCAIRRVVLSTRPWISTE